MTADAVRRIYAQAARRLDLSRLARIFARAPVDTDPAGDLRVLDEPEVTVLEGDEAESAWKAATRPGDL